MNKAGLCIVAVSILFFSALVHADKDSDKLPQTLIRNPDGACWIYPKDSSIAKSLSSYRDFEHLGDYENMKKAREGWDTYKCRDPI